MYGNCFNCLQRDIYVIVIVNNLDVEWLLFKKKEKIVDVINYLKNKYDTHKVNVVSINEKKMIDENDKLKYYIKNLNAISIKVSIYKTRHNV
jgi:hypothetical protein